MGAGRANVFLPQVVKNRGAREAAELRRVVQAKHRDRHGHLADLVAEAGEVRYTVGGVVDGRQPTQGGAENHDQDGSVKKVGTE